MTATRVTPAAAAKVITPLPTPAPVSITTMSTVRSSSRSCSTSRRCSATWRFAMRPTPDAPGSGRSRPGAGTTTSLSRRAPRTTDSSVCSGLNPQRTSAFAMPRSASRRQVFRPRRAKPIASPTERLLLPTPPLPLVTAIARASRRGGGSATADGLGGDVAEAAASGAHGRGVGGGSGGGDAADAETLREFAKLRGLVHHDRTAPPRTSSARRCGEAVSRCSGTSCPVVT